MLRKTVAAILVTCAAVTSVGGGAVLLIRRDRAALAGRFAAERLDQLSEAARRIEGDFQDIEDDLRFAAGLLRDPHGLEVGVQKVEALVRSIRAYPMARIYRGEEQPSLSISGERQGGGDLPLGIDQAMTGTVQRVIGELPGTIEMSGVIDGDPGGWLRVLATPLPSSAWGRGAALALVVDTEPILGKLRLLASDPGSDLLVLEPQGGAAPVTSPRLAAGLDLVERDAGELPGFAALIEPMRAGQGATFRIGAREAVRLGFGPADLIGATASLRGLGSGRWVMATATSTSALRAHERTIVLRISLAAALIVVSLLAFLGYAMWSSRRAVELRERLRHANQIAHLHEKAEKILDHIPTSVLALSGEGRVSAVNRAFHLRVPGVEIGATLARAFPSASSVAVDRIGTLVDEAIGAGRVSSLHGERLRLFGMDGQYSLHAVPLESGPPETRVLLVIEDFTEVRALESQLLRAEKLATVGILAAGIAHEIGTPLGVIRGRAEYLLGKIGVDHPQAEGVRVIMEQIDGVTRTIGELLDFSRARSVCRLPVRLAPIASKVEELLRCETERRRLRVEMHLAEDLPPLAADADQLRQVLVNLLVNAHDACGPGGLIRVTAATPAGVMPVGPARVKIQVADDGGGIPEEYRHRIFDPFFTTKRRGQGTGLGLAIVAQIVRNHAAQIDVRSAPGRGTCVTLLWPTAGEDGENRLAG